MIHLHQLSLFHAVAQTKSVSRAAERLFISQPAVSKQMKTLEQTLKMKLFDRHAKGISLTPGGLILAGYADRIFEMVDAAETSLADLASFRSGKLSVGAGPTVGTYLFPKAMVQFKKSHPSIHLHVETEGPELLRQRLLDGAIEFAVSESQLPSADFQSRILTYDLLIPVVGRDRLLAKEKSVTPLAFCAQPFVVRQVDSPAGSLVERTLQIRGLKVNAVMTVSSTEAIKQAVIAGLGVAIVSRLSVQTEIAAGLLLQPRVKGLSIRYPIYHIWRRGISQSKLSNVFLETLLR
jgi:DNA-binding transcriptional LysR family regulator